MIEACALHWLEGGKDKEDLCAHGGFVIRDGERLVVDESGSDWTLSASAIYLLRTLQSDHTSESPVGDQLFPCCGHAMFIDEQSKDVIICGCPEGYDFQVEHSGGKVHLSFPDNSRMTLSEDAWRKAVFEFSDSVEKFYQESEEKEPSEDRDGFNAFLSEWRRRRDFVYDSV